eukprot:jgi/Botrbrau1/17132/Bobra.0157s0030.2
MSALVFDCLGSHRACSLASFLDYREQEKNNVDLSSVNHTGLLLEYETLELRVHPAQVEISNDSDEHCTVVTIDSANRPGTLVEVVQHFTELALNVRSARISSDGGWFVDVFEVTECNGKKVQDVAKLRSIEQMLSVHANEDDIAPNGDETDDQHRVETTVFEFAGEDKPGLLAEVTELLSQNGCNVRSAAVWTYKGRVAFVLSVTESGLPIQDDHRLQRLRQLLLEMVDAAGHGIVNIKQVRGNIHHDRRLHQLMLQEEEKDWCASHPNLLPGLDGCMTSPSSPMSNQSTHRPFRQSSDISRASFGTSPTDSASSLHGIEETEHDDLRSPKFSAPDIDIQYDPTGYWLVDIRCKDRNKLLFDTVCTLADMNYDVYHATINSCDDMASQEFYIKPRYRSGAWDQVMAEKLADMLEASITRRFPKGLKVHVHSIDRFGCLASFTSMLKDAGLAITRAKVRSLCHTSSCHW